MNNGRSKYSSRSCGLHPLNIIIESIEKDSILHMGNVRLELELNSTKESTGSAKMKVPLNEMKVKKPSPSHSATEKDKWSVNRILNHEQVPRTLSQSNEPDRMYHPNHIPQTKRFVRETSVLSTSIAGMSSTFDHHEGKSSATTKRMRTKKKKTLRTMVSKATSPQERIWSSRVVSPLL